MNGVPSQTTTPDESRRAEPLLVTLNEACRLLGIGRTKAYGLIDSGHLTARKLGVRTLVEAASIRAFAAKLPRAGRKSET